MMIVMKPTATAEEVEAVVGRVHAVGARAHVINGEELTVIGAIGDAEHVSRLALEGAPGVDHMLPISKPYKLSWSQITHGARSVLDIAGRNVGGDHFAMIAGPCTIESREQTLVTAHIVAELTHLPVIVDPSHAAGRRDLVAPMSLAAAAAGADGLIVEVHPDPDEAICDAAQQLVADEFPEYLDRVRAAAAVAGKVLWQEPVASGA
jgi:3-deoxy-D-arabino-heptulosonate 7-phosphate (DAHP) synthase